MIFAKVTYGDEVGRGGSGWYTDLQRKHKVAAAGFLSESQAAFRAGKAAQHVDGSFRLGTFKSARGFDWGVAELPTHNGIKGNYASYWVNGTCGDVDRRKTRRGPEVPGFLTDQRRHAAVVR